MFEPDPDIKTEPISPNCVVLTVDPDGTERACRSRFNGRTILGHAICDQCWHAASGTGVFVVTQAAA